jgi:aldehyde:ferredoxin oxidoreductase
VNVSGYHSAYLRVDLTTGTAARVPFDENRLRQFLGGSALGVDILLSEGAAESDPLSPQAAIAFVFSPLVGSPLTTSAKFAVVSKSPLTQRINDSLASSGFAIAGKKTGHDAIVLTGKVENPSIVIIDNDTVCLQPADDLWGLTNEATQAKLRDRLGPDFQTATIGPAGEQLVRYATISHDGRHAGRGGRTPRSSSNLPGNSRKNRSAQQRLNTASSARPPICSPSIGSTSCPRATSSTAVSPAPKPSRPKR